MSSAPPRVQADLQAHIAWLDQRLAALDEDLDTTLRTSPVWRERETLYRSVPGIGPVCARTYVESLLTQHLEYHSRPTDQVQTGWTTQPCAQLSQKFLNADAVNPLP